MCSRQNNLSEQSYLIRRTEVQEFELNEYFFFNFSDVSCFVWEQKIPRELTIDT